MPNHVTNILKVTGKGAKEILDSLQEDKEHHIDFNKIIKMPSTIEGTSAPNRADPEIRKAIEGKRTKEEIIQSLIDLKLSKMGTEEEKEFDNSITNFIYYGFTDWYGWSCHNWGTKWNAYATERNCDNIISFETAWSTPEPVIKRLSEKYPNNKFALKYADEDTGGNCGRYVYKNGELVERFRPEFFTTGARRYARKIQERIL
jgi:hypothetical protein